ncbi:hypothetical protein KKC97_04045 [bacterium]|nr:hypothetical protein [bacterium]
MRRTAKWLHWIAQILIALLLALRIAFPEFLTQFGDYMLKAVIESKLRNAGFTLSTEQILSAQQRTDDLTSFLPPANGKDLESWAQAVNKHMDQPAGVFYFNHNKVDWPILPEQFTEVKGRIDTLLLTGITCTSAAPSVRKIGTMLVQRASFDTLEAGAGDMGSNGFSVTIIGLPDSPIRWGVVYNYKEAVYPFLRRVEKLKIERPYYDDLMSLDHLFYMRRLPKDADRDSVTTHALGLRVFKTETDSLLFATPDLDTTNFKYVDKMNGSFPYWFEVYDSDLGEKWHKELLDLVGKPSTVPWVGCLIDLFTMFVLAMLYRFVLKATKPE